MVLDVPIISLVKKEFSAIYQLAAKSGVRIVILSKIGTRTRLLVDFRHFECDEFTNHSPVYWLINATTQCLLMETTDQKKACKKIYIKRYKREVLPMFEKEPQNLQELQEFLKDKELTVFYEVRPFHHTSYPWIVNEKSDPSTDIEAFARPDLSLGFRMKKPYKTGSASEMPDWIRELRQEKPPPELKQANRRSSVSVKHRGLTLAYSLGVISKEELLKYSQALSHYVGAIWLTHDEQGHVRHAVYADNTRTFHEEFRCEGNGNSWNSFIDRIEKAGQQIKAHKLIMLSVVFKRLEFFAAAKPTSPWERCYKGLKFLTKKHQVFVFGDDDSCLHTIKGPLASWSCAKPGRQYRKGVQLQTLANYTVTALTTPDFVIVNLSNYFNYKLSCFKPYDDDSVLWELAQQWLEMDDKMPNPEIKHKTLTLKRHAPIQGMTAKAFLKKRDTENARLILNLWTALAVHYVLQFEVDIASVFYFSLSQMAFTIVWTQYAKEGGPMCHSIEQMHSHTEYKLRPWCKGGFSYSCLDEVIEGEALDHGMEVASSIKELDLTSSYGFSGKSMASGCGFGVIFTPETGRLGYRHSSFEYMAVFYTIYKRTVVENRNVKSVYSHFSPLGTINIGKYPIDLVIVYQDGAIEMIQFDGFYVHGDYNNACSQEVSDFINGQSREEVETKTRNRDENLLNWMLQVGQENMSYEVITDCCHLEYNRIFLKHAFATIPELNRLVAGMDRLDGTLNCIDPDYYTFLAIVEGECLLKPQGDMGPIFTSDLKNPTRRGGKMLLTSDYYTYLQPFRVDHVEWIVYYRRCQHLPRVFGKLLQQRQDMARFKSKAGIVKSIINYACGYFGLNSDKTCKTTARVSNRLPHRFNIHGHEVQSIDYFHNNVELSLVKTLGKPAAKRYMCTTPFTLFVGIVEYGKLRLNKALQCLQTHLRPTSMRLLYSNVDNLIVALSTSTFEEALQDPNRLDDFKLEWNRLYGSDPGQLKLEWEMLQDTAWKFISPAKMYYSVIALKQEGTSYHKTCSFKGLGSLDSYNVARKLLDKQSVQVEQVRRIDKLAGTETKEIVLNFQSTEK